MATKQEMDAMMQVYKDQIEMLKSALDRERADKTRLQDQVDRLQEGLMAIRAPQAYQDHRMDRLGLDDPFAPSEKEAAKRTNAQQVASEWIRSMEDPMFRDVDEMIDALNSQILRTSTNRTESSESLHGNEES